MLNSFETFQMARKVLAHVESLGGVRGREAAGGGRLQHAPAPQPVAPARRAGQGRAGHTGVNDIRKCTTSNSND